MKPFDDSKLIEQNAKLEASFKDERDEWNTRVSELVDRLRDSSKLTEAMAYGLSYRQMIIEKLAQYKQVLAKKNSLWDKAKNERYKKYMVEGDLKLTGSEKTDSVNADLTSLRYQIALLQTQIEYFQETAQVLSSFQFAIKNKIQILTEEIM